MKNCLFISVRESYFSLRRTISFPKLQPFACGLSCSLIILSQPVAQAPEDPGRQKMYLPFAVPHSARDCNALMPISLRIRTSRRITNLEGKISEDFAESFDFFVEKRLDRFGSDVSSSHAGTSGGDNYMAVIRGNPE